MALQYAPGSQVYLVKFKPKKYRKWTLPFVRTDSLEWQSLWHKPSHHKRSEDDPLYDSCASCKLLWHNIGVLVKRARVKGPSVKGKYVNQSSRKSI